MAMTDSQVTKLVRAAGQGEAEALDELIPIVYDELKSLAHRLMARERAGHTLNSTALVHEAFLRLLGGEPVV